MTRTVLVTGATGNIGRHVVTGLRERDVTVRAVSRSSADVRADFTDPDSRARAVDGTDAVFLLWPFMAAGNIDDVMSVLATPTRHVVYVSAMSAAQGGVWGAVEDAVRRSGAPWTFLRPGGFATNTLEWAPAIRAGEPVRMPYPKAARSLIHERDIADVAVLALTEPQHVGKTYVLTGPTAPTMQEQVQIIGDVVSTRPVVVEQPVEEAHAAFAAFAGDEFARAALGYWAGLVQAPEPVTGTVEELTGRPARTFERWARDHADDFR